MKDFRELKKSLANLPILGLPKRGGSYMGDKDARKYDLGVELLQKT